MELRPGEVFLEKYEVSHLLGEGGFGRVYKARQRMLNRDVAIKLLHLEGETAQRRFSLEAKIIAKLTHPATVRVHDHGVFEDTSYMVLEFISGRTLRDIIDWRGPMDSTRVSAIMMQVLGALAEAHKLGVIHRDLKPQNIIISQPDASGPVDRVKILDFGMAKVQAEAGGIHVTHKGRLTAKGSTVGTLRYMSPEQMRGRGDIGPASDLFTLGILAYEMLAGGHPLNSLDNDFSIAAELASKRPMKLPDSLEVPDEFRLMVDRLLEKAPEERYTRAEDVIADIESMGEATTMLTDGWDTIPEPDPQPANRQSYVSLLGENSESSFTPNPDKTPHSSDALTRPSTAPRPDITPRPAEVPGHQNPAPGPHGPTPAGQRAAEAANGPTQSGPLQAAPRKKQDIRVLAFAALFLAAIVGALFGAVVVMFLG